MEATTGHYGTRPYQLRFLLEKLQKIGLNLDDIFIKTIVPKNLKDRTKGYEEDIVNATTLLAQILHSQAKILLSNPQHMIPHILSLENHLNRDEKYQQFLSDFNKVPQNLLLSLQELGQNNEFKQLKNKNFPNSPQEFITLSNRIWDSIFPLLKTVQIASLLKTNNILPVSYKKIVKICQNLFVEFINELIKDETLPPIINNHDTRVLFWSSNLGKEASNIHARHNQSLNDVIALKYIGRIFAGWRSDDLSQEYKRKHGDKLNVLFDLLDHRKITPYEDLKKFFWESYSCIHTSQILNTSNHSLLFFQDALTTDNFFMNTELDILRKNDKQLMVQEIRKTLEKLEIHIEGEPLLTEKINLLKKNCQTYIFIKDSSINIVFHDDLNRVKGVVQIIKNLILKDNQMERMYAVKINLEGEENLVYFLEKGASKKLLNLFVPTWNGIFKSEKSIDLYDRMRPRISVPELPTKTRSVYLSDITFANARNRLLPRQDGKETNQLFVATEAPMQHPWLCAYIKAIKEKKRPLLNPIFFTKAFYLEYLSQNVDTINPQKYFNVFLKEMINNLQFIRRYILSVEKSENQPSILWMAFKHILIDAKQGYENLSKALNGLKPSPKNKVYFITVLNAFLTEATASLDSYLVAVSTMQGVSVGYDRH